MKGMFISFEGVEGSGKTTQAARAAAHLEEKGLRVVKTEEPGGTSISLSIRKILLSTENAAMDPITELLLYNAARAQHIKELILPALEKGAIVITDRFSDSTLAYQGFGRGIEISLIDSLDAIVTKRLRPDLTFLLDTDVAAGLRRNRGMNKNDRLELEDISFHERVREGFLGLARKERERIKVIDSSGPLESVQGEIAKALDEFLDLRKIT